MVFSPKRIRIGLDSMAGPYALFRVFSVCIGLIQVGMAPRCGALFRTNGTAVPDGITFRPFSTNFDGYSFWGAGGWALQIVVTRLNLHWPIARRQSNANTASCICLVDDFAGPNCSHIAASHKPKFVDGIGNRRSDFTIHGYPRTSRPVVEIIPKCSPVLLARFHRPEAAQDRRRQPLQAHVCPSE